MSEISIMSIGQKIAKIRKAKGISIYRISQETGISQNHIRDIEKDRRNPSVDTLRRLVEPLGISLAELFNESGEVSYLSEGEKLLVENFRTLPHAKAQLLLDMSVALNDIEGFHAKP